MATKRRPVTKQKPAAKPNVVQSELPIDQRVADLIAALKRHATQNTREGGLRRRARPVGSKQAKASKHST